MKKQLFFSTLHYKFLFSPSGFLCRFNRPSIEPEYSGAKFHRQAIFVSNEDWINIINCLHRSGAIMINSLFDALLSGLYCIFIKGKWHCYEFFVQYVFLLLFCFVNRAGNQAKTIVIIDDNIFPGLYKTFLRNFYEIFSSNIKRELKAAYDK